MNLYIVYEFLIFKHSFRGASSEFATKREETLPPRKSIWQEIRETTVTQWGIFTTYIPKFMNQFFDRGFRRKWISYLYQVFEKDLFKVLRKNIGDESLNALISEKVVPVPGDVSLNNMGVSDSNLLQDMMQEIDIVAHAAATTTFDER